MTNVADQIQVEFARMEHRLDELRADIMGDRQNAFDALRLDVRAALQETRGALTAQLDDLEATRSSAPGSAHGILGCGRVIAPRSIHTVGLSEGDHPGAWQVGFAWGGTKSGRWRSRIARTVLDSSERHRAVTAPLGVPADPAL